MRTLLVLAALTTATSAFAQDALVPFGEAYSNTSEGCAIYSGSAQLADAGTADEPVAVGPWAVLSNSETPQTTVVDSEGVYGQNLMCFPTGHVGNKFTLECSGFLDGQEIGPLARVVIIESHGTAVILSDENGSEAYHRCPDM